MAYGQGPEVLHDIDLTLESGSFHLLSGANGAGKTSLLRVLGLLSPPSRGRMNIFGRELRMTGRKELPELRRKIGMVFQDFRLMRHLSAFDNVALPLRISGVPDDKISTTVSDMLSWLELQGVMERKPDALSVGQQQLVAVARAVVLRPALLLADEPMSNVDERRADRLMGLFSQMSELGSAVVLATHNSGLLRRHSHPVLHIEKGRVGSPRRATMKAAS